MDRRIKLRHLQGFVEIVRQRSMKRAAERLLLTQPAMSRTIAELEMIADARLLTRGRGGVALTPEGEVLYRFAQRAITAVEEGFGGIAGAGGAELRIGALPSIAARLMPAVVTALADIAPDLRLVMADGPHDHLTAQLRAGALDVVIGRLGAPDTMAGLSFTQLYLEDVAIVVRPGHPILDRPDLRRVADWPVIYPPPSAAIRPFVERLLIAEGIGRPPNRIETVSGAFGRVYVRSSDAIWFISTGVVADEIAEGRLVRLPIGTTGTQGPVGLMQLADDPEPDGMAALKRAVTRAVASLQL